MKKKKNKDSLMQRIIDYKYTVPLFSLIICILTFIVLTHYSGYSFWGDEMGTIAIANPIHSPFETLKINLLYDPYIAPLFYLFANLWMKVAPYGTSWLLLPCEILVCAGIFITAMTAREESGNWGGIIACVLSAFMPFLASQGAYEFRPYAAYYLFTVLMLFFYFRKRRKSSMMNLILYGLSAVFCTYNHYVGVFLFFVMFLVDLMLFLKKRITIRNIIPYLLWGVLFLPCMIFAYFRVKTLVKVYWTPVPAPRDFFLIIPEILRNPLLTALWYAGVIWVFFRLIQCIRSKKDVFGSEFFSAFFLYWLIFSFRAVNFLYSRINANYSLWVPRYFLCLLPCIALLVSFMLADVFGMVRQKYHSFKIDILTAVLFAAGSAYLAVCFIHNCKMERYPEIIRQPFEQGAEFLRTMDDLQDDDTAIYYSAHNIEAWQYYLAHGDMTPGIYNLLPKDASEADMAPYRKIYVMIIQDSIPEKTRELFEKLYDEEELHHDYRIFRLTRKVTE